MDRTEVRNGWIEVICGSMFAGKSEELIRRVKRFQYAKKKTLVFKPSIDNRYALDEIVSHSNYRINSFRINKAKEVLEFIEDDVYAVVVDEVQFLDKDIIWVAEELAGKNIRVILAGLDRDFRGEPFGLMPELLARAEYVTKLSAICTICGNPATRTQRIVNGKAASYHDPLILIGATESYEPRCRCCHKVLDGPNAKK